jgi:hypothetical protein
MPTISEIRQQYPDYNDISDQELADKLHTKFYSDIPKEEYYTKIGLKPTVTKPEEKSNGSIIEQYIRPMVRPTIEGLATGIGSVAGAGLGALGGGIGALPGSIAGGTLGYMGGSQLSDLLLGENKGTPLQELYKQGQRAKTGAEYAAGGELLGVVGPKVAKGIGYLGKQALGFTTGKGPQIIGRAFQGGEKFEQGLRGQLDMTDVYDTVKGALQNIRNTRATEYRTQLQNLKSVNQPSDVTPIGNRLDQLLSAYNLGLSSTGKVVPKGVSKLYKSEEKNIQEIVNDVRKIAQNPDMQTPSQLDLFKQKLDNFYSPNKDSRALVTSLRNTVKDIIVKDVPEYEAMTAKYHQSSKFINEIEKSITGTANRGSVDTALRKLSRIMKEDPDYRRELLTKLSGITGEELKGMLAGVSMNPLYPEGLVGRSLAAGEIYSLLAGVGNPKIMAMLTMGSPRIVGEFLNQLGKISKVVKPTWGKVPLSVYGPVIAPQVYENNESQTRR